MAYDCRVYRILIASPSDVEEEREIAVRVIQEWNDLYSYSRKIALLPLRWETHTAPEYGTRPQEVINRTIVDQCDLLVGIFWTRIGSPTGVAESGTIEEIERVGKAEKPIMLYFSRVEIDPDKIDIAQIEKLKLFKKKTYPNGLIESYKTIIEFRDKFAKQLELKVRELQQRDSTGESPLSLGFLSIEKGELIGNKFEYHYDHPSVKNIENVPQDKRDRLLNFISNKIRWASYFPVALAVANSSASGIRNLYIELDISSNSKALEVTDTLGTLGTSFIYKPEISNVWTTWISEAWTTENEPSICKEVVSKLSRYDEDKLQYSNEGWSLSFEWEALQPQRIRLIRPVLYVYSPESATLSIRANIYADSFPEPFILEADAMIKVNQKAIPLKKLVPDYEKLLKEMESK